MVKFGTRAIVEKLLHHGSTNLNESSHNTQNSITPGGKRSNMAQAGVYTTCMFNAASSTNLGNSYRQRRVEKLNLHVPHSMKVVDKWLDGERRIKTVTKAKRVTKRKRKSRNDMIDNSKRMKSLAKFHSYTSGV